MFNLRDDMGREVNFDAALSRTKAWAAKVKAEPLKPTPQRTEEEWAAWMTQQAKEAAEWSEGRIKCSRDEIGGSNG